VADEIEIKFSADTIDVDQAINRVQREIQKLGLTVANVGDQIEFAFSKESQKAIAQSQARIKSLKDSMKQLKDEIRPATKQSVSFLENIQKLRIAGGFLQGALSAATNAAIGFAGGVFEAIRASEDLIVELSDVDNELFQFSETTAENIEKVNDQFNTMLGISKMLTVQFAGEFAHAATEVVDLINHLGLAYGKANKKLLEVSGGTTGLSTLLLNLATGGGYGQVIDATTKLNELFKFQDEELENLKKGFANNAEQTKKAKKEYQDYVKELEKNQKTVDRAIDKLAKIEMRAEVGGLEGMEKLNKLFEQQWQEIDNIAKSALEEADTQEQRAAVIAQHQAAILALNEEYSREVEIQRKKDTDAFMRDIDKEIDLIKKRNKAKEDGLKEDKEKQEKFVSDSQNLMKASAEVMGDISGLFGEMLENAEGKSRQQLMRLFAMQKASAIAQAAINATLASMSALANPPGPPFTIPIAATVAALGAVQVAQIAAEPPPFHIGTRVSDLAPDEARITRREGLAVLTPQGIAAGGAEAVADANAGITPSSMGQTVLFKYDHRMFDATITDNLKRSNSPLGNAIRRSSYGHRRRNG